MCKVKKEVSGITVYNAGKKEKEMIYLSLGYGIAFTVSNVFKCRTTSLVNNVKENYNYYTFFNFCMDSVISKCTI